MEKIYLYLDNSIGVVKDSNIEIGDECFDWPSRNDSKPKKIRVTRVLEQRKESGIYKDESLRRMWAKVEVETAPEITNGN